MAAVIEHILQSSGSSGLPGDQRAAYSRQHSGHSAAQAQPAERSTSAQLPPTQPSMLPPPPQQQRASSVPVEVCILPRLLVTAHTTFTGAYGS